MALRKFIIERNIPKVGSFDAKQLSDAAAKSNEALCQIGAHDIQWVESYVADDKTFCVYLATNEAAIRRHSELTRETERMSEGAQLLEDAHVTMNTFETDEHLRG